MRTCTNSNKTTSALNQTKKLCSGSVARIPNTRRRNFSSHVPPLARIDEAHQSGIPVELGGGRTTSLAFARACSPPCSSSHPPPMHFSNSCSSFTHLGPMPPGPPSSPVPSPPHLTSCTNMEPSSLTDLRSVSVDESSGPGICSDPAVCIPLKFHSRLRRRRNAICGTSALGKGLKEFFTSYVVSHLTDSMTSSLSLSSAGPPRSSTRSSRQHSSSTSPCDMDASFDVD